MTRDKKLASVGALATAAVVAAMAGFAIGGAGLTADGQAAPRTSGINAASPSAEPGSADGGDGGGDAEHRDRGGSGSGSGSGSNGDGDGDGPPGAAAACTTGEFRLGEWDEPPEADPGPVSGLAVAGDDECVRLRITFYGPAPAVRVWRPSEGNHTSVSLAPGPDTDVLPAGPVSPDLLGPDLELLSTGMLTADTSGLAVLAIHGDRTDVAARVERADQHVDVYFRPAQPDDPRVADVWPGGPHHLDVTGAPDQGLAVVQSAGREGAWVVVQGYAKSPESNVVVRVHEAGGDGVICDRHQLAAGPPYLFAWFHEVCAVPRPGEYQVEVGWDDPARADRGVWQWYDVRVD